MDKQQALELIKKEMDELLSYANDVRGDWSDFDGRDLLRRVGYHKGNIDKALAVLSAE